jgi:hypothetical protein
MFLTHLADAPLDDVQAYYLAAQRLNVGSPLYPSGMDPDLPTAYFYPPLLAMVLRPFAAWLDFPAFAALWASTIFVALGALVIRIRPRFEVWVALGFLAIPIGYALSVGQAHVLVTLLLAIGAPWSVALAANIKLFPILAALYWVGRREWTALGHLAAWLVILGCIQLLFDPQDTFAYVRAIQPGWLGSAIWNWSPYVVSPLFWAVLAVAGAVLALRLARTRWGWPVAVALATLVPPRLLLYMPLQLLAAFRAPDPAPGAAAAAPRVPEPEREA